MKNKSVRAVGIALAVILGMAALLYLGGLINQLTIGYQKWLAAGGMTGKATMGAMLLFTPCVLAQRPDGERPKMHLLYGGVGRRPVRICPAPESVWEQRL